MIETTSLTHRPAARGGESLPSLVKPLIDPSLALFTLGGAIWWHGGALRAPEIVLGLLAFSLCYPGTIAFRHRQPGLLREILTSWGLVAGLLLVLGYATHYLNVFDARILAAWLIATPIVQWIVHASSPLYVPRLVAFQRRQNAIVVGVNRISSQLARRINHDEFQAQRVVGFFDDRSPERLGSQAPAPLCGRLDTVAGFAKANRIGTIYIALPMASQPRLQALLDTLRDTTASIYFVPDVFLYDLIQARVDTVGGIPVVAVCESPFHGTTGMVKRLTDLVLALAAILATAPLMVGIAVAIRLTSPGPVLFKQRRYGLDGREIVVWKFRSMHVAEDDQRVRQATRDDDRVTRVGRFLRRSSLDELPQFFNVLQGRMSVIGPRPHAVAHNETYRRLIKGYMIRHKVKPGITGLAQVNGARGETGTVEDMERRIQYDLEYLRHWSVRLDFRIIAKTAVLLVTGDSRAY